MAYLSLKDQPPSDKSSPKPPTHSGGPAIAGRHSIYRGIRSRSGKWVSETREPRKTTLIWLGTYPTPEMAATAYDVAAIALKGPDTDLNFPDMILLYPKLTSTPAAASAAAASRLLMNPGTESSKQDKGNIENESSRSTLSTRMEYSGSGEKYIDEEELLNFPNLMVDMAGGMLVSPPRINSLSSDDSPENSDIQSLWTYP